MFTYEEDLHEEFNNFIPLDEKEQSEEEISNDIEEGDHAYFTNAENFIKTKFLEKKEINPIKIEKKKIFILRNFLLILFQMFHEKEMKN